MFNSSYCKPIVYEIKVYPDSNSERVIRLQIGTLREIGEPNCHISSGDRDDVIFFSDLLRDYQFGFNIASKNEAGEWIVHYSHVGMRSLTEATATGMLRAAAYGNGGIYVEHSVRVIEHNKLDMPKRWRDECELRMSSAEAETEEGKRRKDEWLARCAEVDAARDAVFQSMNSKEHEERDMPKDSMIAKGQREAVITLTPVSSVKPDADVVMCIDYESARFLRDLLHSTTDKPRHIRRLYNVLDQFCSKYGDETAEKLVGREHGTDDWHQLGAIRTMQKHLQDD